MKIYIGADHRGFELKNEIKNWLGSIDYEVIDCGAIENDPKDDYVDFAAEVGRKVVEEKGSMGIVICGSGAGVDITANKIKGVRCSIGYDVAQIKQARSDDDLNILSLASDYLNIEDTKALVIAFLQTEYDPTDNHVRRIEKINQLEN